MKELSEELKAKFLMGECTEEELRAVNAWMDESEENAHELFRLEEIYHLGKLDCTPDEAVLKKAEKKLLKRLEQEKNHQHKLKRMNTWMRYAAIFIGLFLLGGLGVYLFYPPVEAENLLSVTTQGQIKEFMLPDGTKVWLNKNTTLKYPQTFSSSGRKVYLEGEGYFEVKRNPEKPFVVQSEAMQVRVLGTVFNLKSDRTSLSAVATLLKGEIEVKGNHDEGMVVLSPGQRAELNGITRKLIVKQGDMGIENWHDNQFIFDKADIYTIARTLENSYGVKVILSPDIDVQKTYTGALPKKDNVEGVLNLLRLSIPVEYKVVGNSVFLSSKKK
ncbi:MAG: FecR family protein [Bacteroides sp.]|nr:FecR family protein [Bacteroides sp.]